MPVAGAAEAADELTDRVVVVMVMRRRVRLGLGSGRWWLGLLLAGGERQPLVGVEDAHGVV